jgi:glyoxylase-like metal-dependent hydrolase (beta-lactamase superfamily II)
MEIAPGLHRLLGQPHHGVNAYLWLPRRGEPVLFDCGWPWSGKALATELRRLSCPPEALNIIAITHDDVDHSGRLAQLQTVSRAAVYAHEMELPRLGRDHWRSVPGNSGPVNVIGAAAWAIYGRYPHPPVPGISPLCDGDELPGGWMVVHTPGHTPGHAAYFHPALRALIAGDAIGPAYSGRLRAPQRAYREDGIQAIASIHRLAALDPEIICCGHGPVIRNGGAALRRLAEALPAPEASNATYPSQSTIA